MTQKERVLDYLKTHPQGITQYEALNNLGVMRLAARISNLRDDGVRIKSELIKVDSRFTDHCYVSKYTLVGEANEG